MKKTHWFYHYARWNVALTTGTWYHVALIGGWKEYSSGQYDVSWWNQARKEVELTIDGSTIARQGSSRYWVNEFALALPFSGGGAPLTVGRGRAVHASLDGWIDEFRVYNDPAWKKSFTPSSAEYGGSTDSTTYSQYTAVGESILLTNIPQSDDPQVDAVEIWRTNANGIAFFKLIELPQGETTFNDNVSDDQLSLEELPTDNIMPYPWFDDCIGPHNASMFWITRTQPGERGRLYYSAIGRAETMEGFVEVSSDDDPLQKLCYYQGMLVVFSQTRVFQILGTNPYFTKELSGIPGTNRPHSVVPTPYGIAYEANDKTFRLLSGLQANRFDEAIARILSGEAVGNLKVWGGGSSATIATYARGEYLISDSSQTLGYDFEKRRWRNLGIAAANLYYNTETDKLIMTVGTTALYFENPDDLSDNGTAIAYDIETAAVLLSDDKEGVIRFVHVDANVNNETVAAKLLYGSSSSMSLGNLSTASTRAVTTFPANIHTRNASVRLTGDLTSGRVYLYGIDLDVYIPGEERQ